MATVHSKAGSGGRRPRKVRVAKRRSGEKRKEAASRRKASLAPAVQPTTTDRLGRSEGNGAPVRVQARLKGMLRVEMRNLDRVEALLRCLGLAMEQVDLSGAGMVWFPDVVDVAADLAWRSHMDLQDLGDEERIPRPLLAKLKDAWD